MDTKTFITPANCTIQQATNMQYKDPTTLCEYGIINETGHLLGEAFHRLNYGVYSDAKSVAQLWASAPELLAALEAILEDEERDGWELLASSHDQAVAAIKKARGEDV